MIIFLFYRIIEKMQYKKLGKFIRYKREKLKYSLNVFAVTNGIEPAALSRAETLKQGIKVDMLERIAKGFDMTPAEFLTEFENS